MVRYLVFSPRLSSWAAGVSASARRNAGVTGQDVPRTRGPRTGCPPSGQDVPPPPTTHCQLEVLVWRVYKRVVRERDGFIRDGV